MYLDLGGIVREFLGGFGLKDWYTFRIVGIGRGIEMELRVKGFN